MKIKVEVYGLVSGAKRHSADYTQLPPGHRTCSFISTTRGAYSPAAISGARNYSNTQAFTVLPGTHLLLGRESARVGKVPCLGAQRLSIIQPSRRSNPRSLACKLRTLSLSHDVPQRLRNKRLRGQVPHAAGTTCREEKPKFLLLLFLCQFVWVTRFCCHGLHTPIRFRFYYGVDQQDHLKFSFFPFFFYCPLPPPPSRTLQVTERGSKRIADPDQPRPLHPAGIDSQRRTVSGTLEKDESNDFKVCALIRPGTFLHHDLKRHSLLVDLSFTFNLFLASVYISDSHTNVQCPRCCCCSGLCS